VFLTSNAIIPNVFFHGKSQCTSVVELSTNSPSDEPHTIAVLRENGDFPVVPLSDSETPLYDQYRIPMLQTTGQLRTHDRFLMYNIPHHEGLQRNIKFSFKFWWQGIPSQNRSDCHVTRLLNFDWPPMPAVST